MRLPVAVRLVAIAISVFPFAAKMATAELVITTDCHSPMFRHPVSLKVYSDGTMVTGTNIQTVNTQVIHRVCDELSRIGFFDIRQSALRNRLEAVREATGRHIFTHDYETTTATVCWNGRSNQITWEAIVAYAHAFPEIPEFEQLSRSFYVIRTNFEYTARPSK